MWRVALGVAVLAVGCKGGEDTDLPIGDLKEEVLTRAFTATHSHAEVYKIEDIEEVFGGMDQLKPPLRIRVNLVFAKTYHRFPSFRVENLSVS